MEGSPSTMLWRAWNRYEVSATSQHPCPHPHLRHPWLPWQQPWLLLTNLQVPANATHWFCSSDPTLQRNRTRRNGARLGNKNKMTSSSPEVTNIPVGAACCSHHKPSLVLAQMPCLWPHHVLHRCCKTTMEDKFQYCSKPTTMSLAQRHQHW